MEKQHLIQNDQALKRSSVANVMSKTSSKVFSERRKSNQITHIKSHNLDKSSEFERKRTLERQNEFDKIKKSEDQFKSKIKETPRVISSTTALSSKENQITPSLSKTSISTAANINNNNNNNSFFYLKSGLKRQISSNHSKGHPDSLNHTLISMKNNEKPPKKPPQKSFHFDSRHDLNSFLRKDSGNLDNSQNLNQSIYSTTHRSQYPTPHPSTNKSTHNSKQKYIAPTSPEMQNERFQERNNSNNAIFSFENDNNDKKDLKTNSFSKFFEESNFKRSSSKFQKKLFQGKDKPNVNIKTISLVPKTDDLRQESFISKQETKKKNNFQGKHSSNTQRRDKNLDFTYKKKRRLFEDNKKIKKEIRFLKEKIEECGQSNLEMEADQGELMASFENDLKTFQAIKKENLILKSLYEMNKIFNVKFELSSFDYFRNYPEIVVSKKSFQIFQDKLLGRGGFAEVYAGMYQKRPVAIKIITISNDYIKHLLNEILTMIICKHENLVNLYAISIEETKPNEIQVYLIMELMKKDLKQIIFVDKQKMSKKAKYEILCDVLKGMIYLHESNYVHCDLKMQNILLTEKNKAKISDFGLAKTLRTGNTKKSLIYGYSERCSSYEYLVEERISTKGDIWSFGILAYELLKERISWDKLTGVQAVAKVSMKTPFFSMNDKLDDEFENQMIESTLNYNYSQRPCAKELLDKIINRLKTLK